MKTRIFLLITALCLPLGLSAETRKLTDTNGREIEAELIAVRGDQVEMKVRGKVYTLPISKFSEADVTAIKEWGEANPAPIKIRGMYIEIKKNSERLKEPKANDDGKKKKDGPKISRTNFDYSITVRNTSTNDLPDMKVKYTVYKLVRERSTGSSRTENLEEVTGEEEIKLFEKSSDFTMDTETVMTTDSSEKDKKSGTEKQLSETMWGVIVDVYHKDKVVRSGSSPDGLADRVESYKESRKKD